jgi:hypothetical protein
MAVFLGDGSYGVAASQARRSDGRARRPTARAAFRPSCGARSRQPIRAPRNGRLRSVLTGCGAAWLARLLWEQEAPGSNPGIPTTNTKSSSWATGCGRGPARRASAPVDPSQIKLTSPQVDAPESKSGLDTALLETRPLNSTYASGRAAVSLRWRRTGLARPSRHGDQGDGALHALPAAGPPVRLARTPPS